MEIYTIGFTQRRAEDFFGALAAVPARSVIDVRANNRSQLAGFTRVNDLPYFLQRLVGLDYHHERFLAPDIDLLRRYRRKEVAWEAYADRYVDGLRRNHVERQLGPETFDGAVLLCSEPTAERCHRRLAAEYLSNAWGDVSITHL